MKLILGVKANYSRHDLLYYSDEYLHKPLIMSTNN